jgi:hypothetical protein
MHAPFRNGRDLPLRHGRRPHRRLLGRRPSQVASFAIVVNQLQNLYNEFFVSSCDHCRGTGCVTCPHVSACAPPPALCPPRPPPAHPRPRPSPLHPTRPRSATAPSPCGGGQALCAPGT